MATNSFEITKPVKDSDLFLIQQDITGEVNDTNEFTMQLPKGSLYRLVSAQFTALAAAANTATQIVRVEKVSADGLTATTIATFAGAVLQAAAADATFAAPAIDLPSVDFEEGGFIRFALDWGAADTLTGRVSVFLVIR